MILSSRESTAKEVKKEFLVTPKTIKKKQIN